LRTEDELKDIFGKVKNLLTAHREMGLDPPPISSKALNYLETKISNERQAASSQPVSLESLEKLREHIGDCRRCRLFEGRKQLVFGEGSPSARLVFVAEGPGRDEDLAGRPFVGEAGKLLTSIIENGMGLSRKDVYICNVVKCRPPGNRDPKKDEIKACIPFLKQQLKIISPEVICVLGRIAGQALLGSDLKISKDRGKWQSYMDIPVMPTFHPAYILRNPSRERQLKGQVWKDIQEIMSRLGLEAKKNG